MSAPIKLMTPKEQCGVDAHNMLTNMLEYDLESVVVFATLKNGCVMLEKSMTIDTPRLIAALEMAKMQAYLKWKDQS